LVPTGGGGELLNLAKPAQNPYFSGDFFFKISRNLRRNIPLKNSLFWAKIRSVCDPDKKEKTFFTSKFCYLLFYNPTHKTETGIPNNKWGVINSKPREPIVMMGQ
jgi:hypothetical protein